MRDLTCPKTNGLYNSRTNIPNFIKRVIRHEYLVFDNDKLLSRNFHEVKLIAEMCERINNSSKCNLSLRDVADY